MKTLGYINVTIAVDFCESGSIFDLLLDNT